MSGTVLHFSDDMRKENIKSLSWYLLKKYLEGESQCPVLLNVLTEYVSDCEVPGDSYIFVKMLNLLVLSKQVEANEDGNNLAVVKNIYDTFVELRVHCGNELEQSQRKLDQLLAEARCQVIVSHLMYDDIDSALLHWREFYTEENLAEDPLGSQLRQILTYLSEDSYRKKRDDEMNLSIDLFFTDHKLDSLCKEVQAFVRGCCVTVLKGISTIKYNLRSSSNYYHPSTTTAASSAPKTSAATSAPKTTTVATRATTRAASSTAKERSSRNAPTSMPEEGKRRMTPVVEQAKKTGRRGALSTIREAPTGTERVQKTPTGTERVQKTLTETERVRKTPTETECVRKTPTETERVRKTPIETERVRKTPTETERVRKTPTGTERVRKTPNGTERVRKTPTGTERVQKTPTDTVRVRKTPTETERIQKTPTKRLRMSAEVRSSPNIDMDCVRSPLNTSIEEDADVDSGSGKEFEVRVTRIAPPEGTTSRASKSPLPETMATRKVLARTAKSKPKDTAAALREYDFASSSDDEDTAESEEVGSGMHMRDVTVETTPTSRLPARLTPVNFKRSYMTAGNSSSRSNQPSHSLAGFRVPMKKKVRFSVQETEYLMAGIKRYGYGNWAVILSKYPFHPSRDKVSLKDKARNLRGRYYN